jgi:uncharacterized small protein (DUF1192 family)
VLLFIDELRHIRIVRQVYGAGVRDPIGRIRKHETAIPDEILSLLSADEVTEVEAAIARLAQGEQAQLTAEIARLPAMMSAVTDFYRHDATELEKNWIRGAIQEAMRLIRGHDRASTEAANT